MRLISCYGPEEEDIEDGHFHTSSIGQCRCNLWPGPLRPLEWYLNPEFDVSVLTIENKWYQRLLRIISVVSVTREVSLSMWSTRNGGLLFTWYTVT